MDHRNGLIPASEVGDNSYGQEYRDNWSDDEKPEINDDDGGITAVAEEFIVLSDDERKIVSDSNSNSDSDSKNTYTQKEQQR